MGKHREVIITAVLAQGLHGKVQWVKAISENVGIKSIY